MISVPFKATTAGGFAEVRGVLRWDDVGLHAQFEVADALTNLIKSQTSVTITPEQLDRIELLTNWLTGVRIRVRVRDMQVLDRISWREGAEFVVAVPRRDRRDAAEFVEEVTWSLA